MKIYRVHKALTFEIEKKILDKIASYIYKFITADKLSIIALLGALLTSISYVSAKNNPIILFFACLGIFIHWFGDSLDGRVAGLRNEARPTLGHYIDHMLDSVSAAIIIFGISFSGLTQTSAWIWCLVLFLLIMIHSFLKASITGVFEISFEKIGPTEVRIGLIIINLIIYYTNNPLLINVPFKVNLFDLFGILISISLIFNLLKSMVKTFTSYKYNHKNPQ